MTDPTEKVSSLLHQLRVAFAAPQKATAEALARFRSGSALSFDIGSAEQVTEEFSRRFGKQLRSAAEDLRRLPEKTRSALSTLGEHGWYLDMQWTGGELAAFAEALESPDVDAAEQHLAVHYRRRMPDVLADVRKWLPSRASILSSAFNAHARREYELSVPVFLIQADGVCQELLGTQLFRRRDGQPVTARAVRALGLECESFRAALLHPLSVPLPISDSAAERRGPPGALYRHGVLHGESLDYGTEINSLRAISLLYYVTSVLRWDKPDSAIETTAEECAAHRRGV